MATKPQDILHKLKISKADFEQSADWFAKELEGIGATDTRRAILKLQSRRTRYPVAGRMYLFTYDAKHKKTLPKWDVFPLILPISSRGGYITGINLHYLPIGLRIRVINELLKFANNKSMSATTRIVAQWSVIKSLSRAKNLGIENCIKQYLMSHIRSAMIEIPVSSWHKVAILSLEKFRYNSK